MNSSSVNHYENFPVASWLVPKNLRPCIMAIYHLARYADDCADEGNHSSEERLNALDALDHAITCAENNLTIPHRLVENVLPYMQQYQLPWTLWHDLFSAFKQDVTVKRYISHQHLLNYCARSANPIGRLLLPVYNISSRYLTEADALCTALQLINFWQDIAIDEAKDRRYLPDDDLIKAGLAVEVPLCDYVHHPAWFPLIELQLTRAETLLEQSTPLLGAATGRIRWELAFTAAGGARIIQKIRQVKGNVFAFRPTIGLADAPALVYDATKRIRKGLRAL